VDPQLNPANPAQFNAYDYSGNNPLTWSDPSGKDFWGDLWKNAKKVANNVGDFIYTYKAEIVGTIVGIAVTGLCLAATAGAGSIGCVIAGAAAGGAVSGAMSAAVTAAQSGQLFTPQGMLSVATGYFVGGLVGAATGVLGGVVGAVLGKVVTAAASTAVGGAIRSFISTVTSKFKPKPPRRNRAVLLRHRARAVQDVTWRISTSRTAATRCSVLILVISIRQTGRTQATSTSVMNGTLCWRRERIPGT